MKKNSTLPEQPSNTVGEWTKGKMIMDNDPMEDEFWIVTDTGHVVADKPIHEDVETWKANAARIVECWNGYDGLKTEFKDEQLRRISADVALDMVIEDKKALLSENKTLKAENEALKEGNRELLEALTGLYDSIDKQLLNYRFGNEIGKASAAISKHSGK